MEQRAVEIDDLGPVRNQNNNEEERKGPRRSIVIQTAEALHIPSPLPLLLVRSAPELDKFYCFGGWNPFHPILSSILSHSITLEV